MAPQCGIKSEQPKIQVNGPDEVFRALDEGGEVGRCLMFRLGDWWFHGSVFQRGRFSSIEVLSNNHRLARRNMQEEKPDCSLSE
jgi:hypothetical protein